MKAYENHIHKVLEELSVLRKKTEDQDKKINEESNEIKWFKDEKQHLLD